MTRPYDYTSAKDVEAIYAAQDGRCAVLSCRAALEVNPGFRKFIIEHKQALKRGGDNSLANKELRCVECARKKTFHPRSEATTIGSDIFEIAKTKRLKAKHDGTFKPTKHPMKSGATNWPKRKMKSRPFQKRIER